MNRTPLDALDLERIEVVKGAASALYGAGVETGVINYLTKNPFKYRGTSASIYGGTMSNFGVSIRQAGVSKSNRLAYKVTSFYRTLAGFEYNPANADDAALIAKFVGTVSDGTKYIVNSATRQLTDIAVPTYGSKSYSLSDYLEYRLFKDKDDNIGLSFGRSSAGSLAARTSSIDYADFYNDYLSVKLKTGGLFTQFSYLYANNDHRLGNFLNGMTRFLQGRQYDRQAQYVFSKLPEKWDVTVGGDYKKITLNSHGNEYGTNEGNTDIVTSGVYTQVKYAATPKLDLVAAVRYDCFTQAKSGFVAPRLGAVYKITPNHTFRVTYNKAYGRFEGGQLYNQTITGGPPDYALKVWGITNNLDWNTNSIKLLSRLGGGRINSATALGLAEAIMLGAKDSKLSADVLSNLGSLGLTGSSPIALKVNNVGPNITIDQLYKKPVWNGDPTKLRPSTTQMYEFGYQGWVSGRLSVLVDLWLMKRFNFYSNPQVVTPIASAPALVADLKAAILASADPAKLVALGVTADQLATAIGSRFTTRLGLIDIKTLQDETRPTAINTFTQGADLQYWGIDLGSNITITPALQAFAGYSYLDKNQFSTSLVGNENSGLIYYLLQPQHRIKAGLTYAKAKRPSANLGMIHNTGFDSPAGPATVQKVIISYTVVDAGVGYAFGNGLQLNATATNVLNQKYRALPQWPQTGRVVLLKATYQLPK